MLRSLVRYRSCHSNIKFISSRHCVISNYWMRLSRIWRILQVEESVIHRGWSPRWVTPSEIYRIFHILRKPNSIIALLFIQNIFFAQTCKLYLRRFLSLLNDTTLCPGFLGQWFNNLLTPFWRQWFINLQWTELLMSLVQYDRILGQQQLFMVNYACGFNQLETGKYFEWIIMKNNTLWHMLCNLLKTISYSVYIYVHQRLGSTCSVFYFIFKSLQCWVVGLDGCIRCLFVMCIQVGDERTVNHWYGFHCYITDYQLVYTTWVFMGKFIKEDMTTA